MVQFAILSGATATARTGLAKSYPVNLLPVVEDNGISKGYLRLAPGVRKTTTLTGADRGGFDWQGTQYRVVGTSLVRVGSNGGLATLGDVGAGGRVQFAVSFDYLAIASGGRLYYWSGTALTQVTDPDLGVALSAIWIDGYFMTTDGTSLVVTELNNPFAIDPLKYGSSEADPDPVIGLLTLRGSVYALNRYTVEQFGNTGGTGFPFARQRGAQIPKGVVGRDAYSMFVETFAFVGSGRNEAPAVYLAGAGQAIRISPRELDDALMALSSEVLSLVEVEAINGAGLVELRVHLPDATWCYDYTTSQKLDQPVWHLLAGGTAVDQPYPARGLTYSGGQWWCASATALGYVDPEIATVFDVKPGYRFDSIFFYNGGLGAIVHALEIAALTGEAAGSVFLSWTDDGRTWGTERACSSGAIGQRNQRLIWRRIGRMRNWRSFRFRGVASAPIAFMRGEAEVEALNG